MNEVDVAVVGGGPAGCAAAVALRRTGATVAIVEREDALGGIARHSDHTGYGLREFRRLLRGPAYARRWARRVEEAGARALLGTTVTGWAGTTADRTLEITSATGVDRLHARAVVLSTGTRERPRSARLVPGSRRAGILTTGSLQQLAASGLPVGRRAVIVGAEHVSFSAVLTLAHAGCRPVAIVTPEARHQTHEALRLVTARRHRVPVLTRTRVSAVCGRTPRISSVEVTDLETGTTRPIECDTIVFTGDWVPDHELSRRGGLEMDAGTRAPRVDAALRTSVPGVFAAGNLLHGAETAAACVSSGAWVARSVADWLGSEDAHAWEDAAPLPIECEAPLIWISPSAIVPGQHDVPRGRFVARSSELLDGPTITVRQGDRELWSEHVRRTVPTMPVHVSARWLHSVQPGAPITVAVS